MAVVGSRGSRTTRAMFQKDPDTLPFFSIHPVTKVGRFLRIVLAVFVVLVVILQLMANWGLLFYKLYELSYLIYLIPMLLIAALCILGLFKRMSTMIGKVLVPGILGFMVISLFLTMCSMMSITSNFSFAMAGGAKGSGVSLALMRTCTYPEDVPYVTVNEGQKDEYTTPEYTYRSDAYRYTAFPAGGIGSSEGEILVSTSSTYNVESEWVDANTCRYFISSDSEGTGYGEIIVRFDAESECKADEGALYRSNTQNPEGTHTANLYRTDSYIERKTTTIYMLTEECFQRVYTAYPLSMYVFLKTNTRVEGTITVEPFGSIGTIKADDSRFEEGIITLLPGDDNIGATGSITVYLNEKAPKENNKESDETAETSGT